MPSIWLPRGITAAQEQVLMDLAASAPAHAQPVANAFVSGTIETARPGLKPTVPIEDIDAAIGGMTFEEIIAVKQRADRDTVRRILDRCEVPSVVRRWQGSADNRRRLIDAVISRVREHFGGPVSVVGKTAEETEDWLLGLQPSPPYHPPATDAPEAILAAINPQPTVLEQAEAMQ